MLSCNRFISGASLCLAGLLLQGCSAKIDCNGNQVKKDVLLIVKENLEKANWYIESGPAFGEERSINDVRTVMKNDELKTASCAAQYTVIYNKTERKIPVEYNLSYLEDKKEVQVLAGADDVKLGIMQLVMRERPVKNGIQKIYDPKTGNLVQSIEWKDNVKNGKQKLWKPDGTTLLADIDWVDGKSNGWEKNYDSQGKLVTDLIWKNGLATGYITEFSGGTPSAYTTYKDGKKNGEHKVFGVLASHEIYATIEDNYVDDKLDGVQRKYYLGKLERESVYKDGVLISDKEIVGDQAAISGAASGADKCVNARIDAFHKANGDDASINNDVLQEWTAECSKL